MNSSTPDANVPLGHRMNAFGAAVPDCISTDETFRRAVPLPPILIALSVLANRAGGGSAGIGDGESAIRIGDRTSRVLHL